jgi:hypothetical protein
MIVRIQGSGQYRLDGAAQSELASIDARLVAALERGAADEAQTLAGAGGEPGADTRGGAAGRRPVAVGSDPAARRRIS